MASRQLKVLLAGSDSHDLAAAQAFMTSKGMAATVCTSNSEARAFIGKGDFDVILAQVTGKPSASGDQVDGLGLLQLPQTSPIAVFLDFDREPSLATSAVELGAVDVLPQPLAANATAQLAMVWQHSLRRKRSGSSSELDTNDSQGSHSLSRQLALTARQQRAAKEEALIKELLPGLFDADSEAQTAARSGDQSSVAMPDTPEIYSPLGLSTTGMHTPLSPFLSAELQQQSCQESDACCLDSRHDSCQFSADLDRLLGGEDLQLDIEPGTSGDLCRVLSGASLATSFDEALSEEERKAKKQKVEWTEELHRKFVSAVELLGADKAVPSKILEHMGCAGTGLTRQNIASHLQKYRNRKRSRPELGLSSDQYAFGPTPLGLPNCWPGPHGPSPFGGLPTFVPTADVPWGMGAAPVLPPAPAAVPGEDIRCAIQELLKKPKANPPLGLKLDTRDVLKQLNQARITISKQQGMPPHDATTQAAPLL